MAEIKHFGVPGMKWGVRKQKANRITKTEAKRQNIVRVYGENGGRAYDMASFGKRGVKRIQKRIISGTSAEKARAIEDGRRKVGLLLGSGVFLASAGITLELVRRGYY